MPVRETSYSLIESGRSLGHSVVKHCMVGPDERIGLIVTDYHGNHEVLTPDGQLYKLPWEWVKGDEPSG